MIALVAGLAGVMAGGIHVLAGADHLAAVAPLAARGRRRAWAAGLRWGIGHAGGVAIVAALAFVLREAISLESLSSWSERVVGVTLIAIGVWAVTGAGRSLRTATPHRHAESGHSHGRIHRRRRQRASLLVGLVHGAAGGSHILGIVPALALPSRAASVCYLAGFGAGTALAMTLFAALAGAASGRFAAAGPRAWAGFLRGCGATSVAVGVFWLVR